MKVLLLTALIISVSCIAPPEPDEVSKKVLEEKVQSTPVPQINHTCDIDLDENDIFNCQLNVYDSDSSIHTWSLSGFTTCTWVTINSATGKLTGTATIGDNCQVAVKVTDNTNLSSTLLIPIHINNTINDAPIISDSCTTAATEGSSYTCSFLGKDEDRNTITYSLTASNTCSWASFASSTTAKITGIPQNVGSCLLQFKATDGLSFSNTISKTITISEAINDAPVISASCSAAASEGSAYSCSFTSTDEELHVITYSLSITNTCTWASFAVPTTAAVSGTPSVSGSCLLAFIATDSMAEVSSVYSKTITIANTIDDIPTITQTCLTTPNESENYSCTFVGYDEEGASLTYSLDASNTCSWAKIEDSSSPTITGLPTTGSENCNIAFVANDGVNNSAIETVNIIVTEAVNDRPFLSKNCNNFVDENNIWTCTFGVTDEEGDAITYDIDPSNTCTWVTAFDVATAPTITAMADIGGTCTLAVRAFDGSSYSPTKNLIIDVRETATSNDLPEITQTCATALNENENYQCSFTGYDEEGATLTYHLDPSTTCEWATIAAEGIPFISGFAADSADCNIVFYASDGTDVSPNETVAITITDTYNDVPTLKRFNQNCSNTATEGSFYSCRIVGFDEEGVPLNFTATTGIGGTCVNWTALSTYQVGNDWYISGEPEDGNTTCTFQLDSDDGVNNSNTITFTINVQEGENDPPTFLSHTCANNIKNKEFFECEFSASDSDVGDILSYTTGSLHTCYWASVQSSSNPRIAGSPSATGTCEMHFRVSDGEAFDESLNYTFTINANDELGFYQLATGDDFSCGLTDSGIAYCWGGNAYGQLGDGTNVKNNAPQVVNMGSFPSDYAFKQITAGNHHACGLTASGKIYCWGKNDYGQLGDGTIVNSNIPVLVLSANFHGSFRGFTQVETGDDFTCGLLGFGGIYCWGKNDKGQIGNNDIQTSYFSTPQPTINYSYGSDSGIRQISLGGSTACGITPSNNIYCWGDNTYNQLGQHFNGAYSAVRTQVSLSGEQARLITISVGKTHICGVNIYSDAICWGDNSNGQLGNNSSSATTNAVKVDMSAFTPFDNNYSYFNEVKAGENFTCGISVKGQVYCWGKGSSGQIGENNFVQRNSPKQINYNGGYLVGTYGAKTLSLGKTHACFASYAGLAYCWGDGSNGQLGNPQLSQVRYPYNVNMNNVGDFGLRRVFSLSESPNANSTCASSANGKSYCWGNGTSGQLGDKATVDRTSPVLVTIGTGIYKQISNGHFHSCGLTPWANVTCWGENTDGSIGNGTTSGSYVTVPGGQISSPNDTDDVFKSISLASSVGFAVSGSKSAFAWGENTTYPSLGIWSDDELSPASQASPFRLFFNLWSNNGIGMIKEISAGNYHGCIIETDSTVSCWGRNDDGQAGVTPSSALYNPKPIDFNFSTGILRVAQISSGGAHTCMLTSVGTVYCFGDNVHGQLGDGNNIQSHTPLAVDLYTANLGGNMYFTQISSGGEHTCGINAEGEAFCWGYGATHGQLGNGVDADQNTPVKVDVSALNPADQAFKEIRAYSNHSCGLTATGKVYCWGQNNYGQLGNGTTTESNLPVPVSL